MFAILGRILENAKSTKKENVVTPTRRKIKDQTRKGTEIDRIHLDPHHPPNPRNPGKVEERERKERDPQHHLQKERM